MMVNQLKTQLKKIMPVRWLQLYHKSLALIAATMYRHPSRRMIIIGVTGTKGKSSVTNIIWQILTAAGYKVGLTSTVNYRIGTECNLLSTYKMTMLGRFKLQQWLQRMARAKCHIAVVETTSEGIKQWRHFGIAYDMAVFTNLSSEHLESHGGWEKYKQAKLELFRHLASLPVKKIAGRAVPRASVVNMDDPCGREFFAVGDYQKVRVGANRGANKEWEVALGQVSEQLSGTLFTINNRGVKIPLLGKWNAVNVALGVGAAMALGISMDKILPVLSQLEPLAGRMEFIDEGQTFKVVVDYAHEPKSLQLLYEFFRARDEPQVRLITLISSTGGGRDVARREQNGRVAAQFCDYVIVTNEDPYDDDPQLIIDDVAAGVLAGGKVEGQNFWRILDRRGAIQKAFRLARPGDVVFLTAKGAEQNMVVGGGRKIPWDDRSVTREILRAQG